MRAVTVRRDADARRLELVEVADPVASGDAVLVAVRAISLNNGEVRHALDEAEQGYRPGWDIAGIVEAAPPGSALSVGDRVVGLAPEGGGWAEKVALPPQFLAPIPDSLSFERAATLPVAALTAAVALGKKPLRTGDRVLVTAATGGVGMIAIQLARAAGAQVTAYVRTDAEGERLRSLGADAIAVGVDQARAGGPYDLILEGVGGALLGEALGWLAARGWCVLFGDAAGRDELTTFDARAFRLDGEGMFGGTVLYGFFLLEELTRPDPVDGAALLADLADRLAAGSFDPQIARTASWREIDAVAHALIDRGFNGKAVLTLD